MAENETETPTCRGITTKGERCRVAMDLSESGLCLWHDPERAEEAKAVQSRGGQAGAGRHRARVVSESEAPSPPKTLNDCVSYMSWLITAVVTGKVDARTCREAVAGVRELRMSLEKRDYEKQLEEAHRTIERLRRGLKVV